jgi:hypothetical protein
MVRETPNRACVFLIAVHTGSCCVRPTLNNSNATDVYYQLLLNVLLLSGVRTVVRGCSMPLVPKLLSHKNVEVEVDDCQ